MARIELFEDLIALQKARELTKVIYEVMWQGGFGRDAGLSGQIQNSMLNAQRSALFTANLRAA